MSQAFRSEGYLLLLKNHGAYCVPEMNFKSFFKKEEKRITEYPRELVFMRVDLKMFTVLEIKRSPAPTAT